VAAAPRPTIPKAASGFGPANKAATPATISAFIAIMTRCLGHSSASGSTNGVGAVTSALSPSA